MTVFLHNVSSFLKPNVATLLAEHRRVPAGEAASGGGEETPGGSEGPAEAGGPHRAGQWR